jgi:hypothetical protein
MKKNKNIVENNSTENDNVENNSTEKNSIENTNIKKFIALKTIKVLCNGEFQLELGQEIPKEISPSFINSLLNSNLIK